MPSLALMYQNSLYPREFSYNILEMQFSLIYLTDMSIINYVMLFSHHKNLCTKELQMKYSRGLGPRGYHIFNTAQFSFPCKTM